VPVVLIFLLLTGFLLQTTPQFEVASVKLHVQAGPEMGGISEMPPPDA